MTKPNSVQLVHFNPNLIALLQAEHDELISDCDLILRFMQDDQNLLELNRTFNKFASLIHVHWKHKLELYMYLKFTLSTSDGLYNFTRSESLDIPDTVNSTINLYTNNFITTNTLDAFKKDFSIFKKVLITRMSYEEKYLFKEYCDIH